MTGLRSGRRTTPPKDEPEVLYCPMNVHLVRCYHDCEGCPLYVNREKEKS